MTRTTPPPTPYLDEHPPVPEAGRKVRHGQLWADKDAREVKRGKRQHLRVVGIDTYGEREDWKVHLNDEDTGRDSWVLRRRLFDRFRRIEDPSYD